MIQGWQPASRPGPFAGSEFPEEQFRRVRDVLLEKRAFDLDGYKNQCIMRRIAARVRARGLADAAPYAELLARDEAELDALLATLTIHVSQFYRNPSVFALLAERILPELLKRARSEHRLLRLWSVGCAGGEEPYSLALLLDELRAGDSVSILGTDISRDVLERARLGVFEPQRLAEVPTSVRERRFFAEGRCFRLAEEIRRLVRFERHDVLTAAAYPEADLIICRNLLIYLARREQERILRRFAAALPAGGILVLGKAEMLLGDCRQLFQVESAAERIYRRR